jgi:hypothetical protein
MLSNRNFQLQPKPADNLKKSSEVAEVCTLDQVVPAAACESSLQHADMPSRKHL